MNQIMCVSMTDLDRQTSSREASDHDLGRIQGARRALVTQIE